MSDLDSAKQLPLRRFHEEAGARFGVFAGWSMPLTYPAGVLKEHLHCRSAAGLFDISHMRLFLLTGPQAAQLLGRACPLDASALANGQSKYTFFLDEEAGILDDLIVTRLGADRFALVANAGNADADEVHLRALARQFDCAIEAPGRVLLAVQGPDAAAVAERADRDFSHLAFMQGFEPRANWFVTRSGYTGEDGFEIALPPGDAATLAERLLADERVQWVGLAARDSLRLEAGLCLYGQDITPQTSPVEAGLLWAIAKPLRAGGAFIGAEALAARIAAGATTRRVGLKPQGRQPVRAGAAILDADGLSVGHVTSGGFGPSWGGPVAMGYVDRAADDGRALFADVRGARLPLSIHSLPFQPHRYRKG